MTNEGGVVIIKIITSPRILHSPIALDGGNAGDADSEGYIFDTRAQSA